MVLLPTVLYLLSGCSSLSEQQKLRAWQELRKEASVKFSQAQDRGSLADYMSALREAESMGPNALERTISLNELSQIILAMQEKTPVQVYIDETLTETEYWIKTEVSDPQRAVSFTELSEALCNFAAILRSRADALQAQKLDERALQICQAEASRGTSSPNILLGYRWGRVVYSLGEDYLAQGKLNEGHKAIKTAMESPIAASVPQSTANDILQTYARLSGTTIPRLKDQSQAASAKNKMAEELGLSGSGSESAPVSQWSKYLRAGKGFLYNAHDASSAVPMLEKAVEQARKTPEPDVPTAQSLLNLGIAYEQTGKTEQAESSLLEAIKILENVPTVQEELQSTLGKLASLYQKKKDFVKAEKYATKRIDAVKSYFGDDSTETGLAMLNLAEVMKARKEFTEAEHTGQEGVALVAKNVESDDARLALAKTLLAAVYIEEKKYGEARPILADAMKIWSTQRSQNESAAHYADLLYARLRSEEGSNAGRP
ncbi:MAG TPA: tetratricopeptide repeat protein [Oculatellaceae cyanobacterium]